MSVPHYNIKLSNIKVILYLMNVFNKKYNLSYQGEPFMEGLRDNKPLLYSILVSGGVVLALAAGIFPDLSNMFEIVYFPPDVSRITSFYSIVSNDILELLQ